MAITYAHIICRYRVDLNEMLVRSSQELSLFLITIIRTSAKADVLYKEAKAEI